MIVIGLIVLILLKLKKMKRGYKVALLLISTLLFGFLGNIPAEVFSSFAMHPSPMCAATKPLLFGFGIPFMVTLAVIFFLTLLGPKLFCGWICPVGALQELITMLGDRLKIKRSAFSYRAAFAVRSGIFILFLFLSATAILHITHQGRVFARSLYDYVNAFHGLELALENSLVDYLIHYLPFVLTVVLAFKYYRPFCHWVCPLGIFTHVLEQIAIFRIRLNKKTCTDCGICESKSPCAAIPDILADARLRPDCFSCNVCVESCPEGALDVGIRHTAETDASNR
jgi:polyferredoxin